MFLEKIKLFVETFNGFCWFDIFLLCIYDRVDQDTHSCALQSIIFSESNCDYTFTYEKRCCLKNMSICLFVYFDSHKIVPVKVHSNEQ
jgi:hypothetical protein